MGRPGRSAWWSWLLFGALSLGANAEPHCLVVVPAVVESGTTVQFCFSLIQSTYDDITVTVSLESKGERRLLYKETHDGERHTCSTFQAPVVESSDIQNFEVAVQGKRFYHNETRKIQIRNFGVRTFIQTDKPLYLPGQTVHFRVVTLDSKLRPAVGLYNVIEIQDPQRNRVAQWLDHSSEGKILQLSYDLTPEAKEGRYTVSVSSGGSTTTHSYEVEKYVLPKFSVEIKAPAEVSIALEQVEFQVCAKYTFGQSVPGSVEVDMCRLPDIYRHYGRPLNDLSPPCHKEQQQVAKDGCASFLFQTSQFKNGSWMRDEYVIQAKLTEEGTGFVQPVNQNVQLSYQIGKVEFVDPPTRYNLGDILDVKVRVVHYNDTPVSNTEVHLKNNQVPQTLQTDQNGLALFKVNTSSFAGDFTLRASLYSGYVQTYRSPHFTEASVHLTEIKPPSLHTKTSSTLEVQDGDRTLVCGRQESFTVGYTIVGEGQGTATIMYLVLSRGVIIKYGNISTYMDTRMQGDVTFKMEIVPDMAPAVTVVAYAVLPSESVIATSQDFKTEKCFSNKIWLEFSPPSSVPGEDSSLKVSASPLSLCGLSAVDKSILIKKPGKTLDPDKFFGLLPVTKAQSFPDRVEDHLGCVKVRNRRSVLYPRPLSRDKNDVYHVLKEKGLKMVTNLFIRTPSCVNLRGIEYYQRSRYDYNYEYSRISRRRCEHSSIHSDTE